MILKDSIIQFVRTKQLQWFGLVKIMDANRLLTKSSERVPTGKKRGGRPEKKIRTGRCYWNDGSEKIIGW